KAFDYFILPSVKEGLPYTILEAGLAGIPTIASKVGGIPEIITNNETGLLTTPANPLSLKAAMRKLAKDHNLADKIAEKNKENIKNNFSLEKTLHKTEELYLKLF
ncbi:glycosyltransferase family 4 protein, partial [bacterium]|nr:glycosyltransferase family 4 protein [bacterium]